ncbi:hypothetical protein GOODEAATRI_005775, partial [Goodea atripinnis]
NFTIIYIKMGYPRLEVAKQCELAPTLITAMEGKPQPQQDRFSWLNRLRFSCFHTEIRLYVSSPFYLCVFSLMHLLIPTLYHMKYPADPSKSLSPFNLTERPKMMHLLLEFMLDVLLMPYGFVLNESPTRPAPSSSQGSSSDGAATGGGQGLPQPPPGMSVYAAKRVIGEAQWNAEQLEQGGNVKQELKHEPVSTRVKLKILPHLLRSRLAAECFPANIQVVLTLFSDRQSSERLLLFLQWPYDFFSLY